MKIGLFFGSFNPIHNGHLMLANYFVEFTDIEQVWFVVSPQSPLKDDKTLANQYDRYAMVDLALEGYEDKYRASNIEFSMPKPSYTARTLAYLSDAHPRNEFVILAGADNFLTLPQWYNFQAITQLYTFYVYPRKGSNLSKIPFKCKYKIVEAPEIEISSTFVRSAIAQKKDLTFFVPHKVLKYIEKFGLYEK